MEEFLVSLICYDHQFVLLVLQRKTIEQYYYSRRNGWSRKDISMRSVEVVLWALLPFHFFEVFS